jgi:phosphoribosylanthranilate isomerase
MSATGEVIRVKICGITGADDARLAADSGADAVGLNFFAGPRRITLAKGQEILAAMPERLLPIALVKLKDGQVSPGVRKLLAAHRVRWLQLYGPVDAEAVSQLGADGFSCIWPFAVRSAGFAPHVAAELAAAQRPPAMVLLDARDPVRSGGTARSWRWQWLADARRAGHLTDWPPIMLAGALTPDNVARAIHAAGPAAVDVSSGVESAPGQKDAEKVRAFVRAARSAWQHRP